MAVTIKLLIEDFRVMIKRCLCFVFFMAFNFNLHAFQIFVKAYQKTYVIHNAEPDSSIQSIYDELAKKAKLPWDHSWMLYSGKILEREGLVKDYHIHNMSTIFLHFRPMFKKSSEDKESCCRGLLRRLRFSLSFTKI